MFEKFIESLRNIVPQTKVISINGEVITDENVNDLKKAELIEYIELLEADRETQKGVLNNLEKLQKGFSDELRQDAELTTLTKIQDIDSAIEKAKKKLKRLKMKFADTILTNHKGEILFLLRRTDAKKYPGLLGLPGGHVDPGESFEDAAKRELEEETNLEAVECDLVGQLKTNDVEISYYRVTVDEKQLLILDAEEHKNWCWKKLSDLDEDEAIPGLKDKLTEILEPKIHAVRVLRKAWKEGKITEEAYLEALIKAKGPAQIGEERTWGKQKMKKTAQGWVPVGSGKGDKKEEEKKDPKAKKEDSKKKKQPADKKQGEEKEHSPEQLSMHAKNTSTESLQATAEDPNANPEMQQAAAAELEERGVKPSAKQRLKEKVKDWHAKQVEFYQSGALDADSEERKGLANLLRKKKDGMIKHLKHEVAEIKDAGIGLKKFFTGNKSDITEHEKKAIKKTAIHLGLVVGSMAATGGLSTLAAKGIGALGKGIALHYLEHEGLMALGSVLAFAKAEGEMTDDEIDKILSQLIDKLLAHVENGNISEDDWLDMGDSAKDDFSLLMDDEEEGAEGEKKEEKKEEPKKEDKKDK